MGYQRIRCNKGHSFMAYVYSSYQRFECDQCRREKERESSFSRSSYEPPSFSSSSSEYGFPSPAVDIGSSPSGSSFSSGGGGDFGGGGSYGDW